MGCAVRAQTTSYPAVALIMEYKYKCDHCKKETTITKPMAQSERPEFCEICESELKRIYEAGMIKTNDGIKK
jgi:predicted nucleic acid-binding Zn ribbon protein